MAFADAIQSMLIAQADPNAQATSAGMSAFVKQMESTTQERKLETISKAGSLLEKAITSNAPQSVIDAYERILAQASQA